MMRVDFSRNAPFYDRRHGAVAGRDVLEDVARIAGLGDGAAVLEVGAGTGRVSVALAGIGCHVVAIEPALPMLECLRRKAAGLDVTAVVGEGAHLPFPDSSFDGVVLARVLYLMTDWRDVLSEVARVSRAHAPLLHEWGNGDPDEEWVQIRAMARTLFEQAGVKEPFHPGARSETKVEPNCVYVIPPAKSLAALDGELRLEDLPGTNGRHVAIDLFFRTLADTYGPHASPSSARGRRSDMDSST